jgi:hypothetical protein
MRNLAENILTATRIGNNATVANMEAFSAIIQRRKEDAKEFQRLELTQQERMHKQQVMLRVATITSVNKNTIRFYYLIVFQ